VQLQHTFFKKKMFNMFLGDPLDRSLRKVEIDILIPKKMREKARDEKCSEEVNGKSHKYTYCSHYKLYLITSVCYFVYIYMHACTHTHMHCMQDSTNLLLWLSSYG